MNLLRFVAALLLLSVSAFGQAVDYRALGTNSYYTNGLRVNDKHWTNSAGLYRYQPLTGTVAAGQPGPPFVIRSDGSTFVGTNVFQDVAPTAAGVFFPYVISMTDSNEANIVNADWWAIDSENYGVYGGASLDVQQAGSSLFRLSADSGPTSTLLRLNSTPGASDILLNENTDRFLASANSTNVIMANSVSGQNIFAGQSDGTNFFVIHTNGGIFMGRKESIEQHWGSFLGYETLVSIKDPSLGDNDRSEIEVGVYDSANNVRGSMNVLFLTNHADIQLYAAVNNSTNYRTSLWNVHKDSMEFIFKSNEPDPDHGHYLRFLPDKPAATVGPSYIFNTAVFQTNTATTSPLIAVRNFSTNKFLIMPDAKLYWGADATLGYTPPPAYGAVNSVLTDTDGAGTLAWTPVSGGAGSGVGPGTNTYLSMFNSTGTNVINSPVSSPFTNSIEMFKLANGGTFTNGATTNRMYSMFAHAGTNTYLEFISAVPFSAEAAHIRHNTTGFSSQRAPIYMNDSVAIEPAANQLGGHGAGYIYPLADGTQDNGTTSLRWRDVNLARVVTAPARDDSIIFGTGFTGQGFGVGTAGTLYFTGPGSFGWQMNRDKNTGSPQLDMSSSLLGFGTSTSNSVSYLQESTLTGYVQVGTNNANTATARAQGIIAARASGTDRPGSDLLLAAGMGTGNAITPKIRFQSSNPGSTGSGLNNTLIDRMLIDTNTVTIYSNLVVNGTISGGGALSGGEMLSTTNSSAAAGRVFFTTNGTAYLGTNFTGAFVTGGIYGTNAFAIDVPGAVSALIVKTNGGVQSSTVIGVGAVASATASSIQMSPGGGSQGYLEFWHGTTRRGYMGFGTTTLPLTLENGASFVVTGGNQTNTGSIASGVAYMLPTNYVAANFTPVAGMVKIVSSNGVLWKVSELTTNLLSQNIP